MNVYIIFKAEKWEGGWIVSVHQNYISARQRLEEEAKKLRGRKKWNGDYVECECDYIELQAHRVEY